MTRDRVERRHLSPVRSHRENAAHIRACGIFPRTHSPYDYNEVYR